MESHTNPFLKTVLSLCCWIFILVISSCTQVQTTYDNSIDYMAFRSSENGKWGMISTDGKVLLANMFTHRPELGRNGMFMYQNIDRNDGDEWEIYTLEAQPKRIGKRYAFASRTFINGRSLVADIHSPIYVIDCEGNKLMTLDSINGEKVMSVYQLEDSLYIFSTPSRLSGAIDYDGKVVIKPVYDNLAYNEGLFVAEKTECTHHTEKLDTLHHFLLHDESPLNNNTHTIVLDKNGKQLFETNRGVLLSSFSKGYAIASLYNDSTPRKAYAEGIIKSDGTWSIKPTAELKTMDIMDGNLIFIKDNRYGVMDVNGKIILPARYQGLFWASSDRLYEYRKAKQTEYTVRLMDLKGNYKGNKPYYAYSEFHKNYALVMNKLNEWIFIDKEGREMVPPTKIYDIDAWNRDFSFIIVQVQK